jgi:hypothetical protein
MINKRVQRNWRDLCAFQQLFSELFTLRPSLLLPVASFGKRPCEINGWLLKQSPKDQAQEMVGRLPETNRLKFYSLRMRERANARSSNKGEPK